MLFLIKKTSTWLPLAMSLTAITMTISYVTLFGVDHTPHDEGAPAHIFQLLMVAQVFIIAYFALTWLPKKPKQGVPILLLHLLAIFSAFLLIFFLEL